MKVSIVIPCYNAVGKFERCLSSLRSIQFDKDAMEVVFVDDGSTDSTAEILETAAAAELNWRVERLPFNSGSASAPRNHGIVKSRGDYIFFLDCDDEILPDAIALHYEKAVATDASIVRGYLYVDDGKARVATNHVHDWPEKRSRLEQISAIVSQQSTTNSSLLNAAFLRSSKIWWPEDIRMGEDTIFLVSALTAAERIAYVDCPAIVYNKRAGFSASVTGAYGRRELSDHIRVWRTAEEILNTVGLSYVELRFRVAITNAMKAMIFTNRGDIDRPTFVELSRFVQQYWKNISDYRLDDRYTKILQSIFVEDYESFAMNCRPRLVIAGYDLKFIESARSLLERHFEIRFDVWHGHDLHDEKKSRELLKWCDIIWCEWMLGNAVWYSNNKRLHQKLIIRIHRMELDRDFGNNLRVESVSAFVAVSVYFFEKILERFPSLPREKLRLVPNFIDMETYDSNFHIDRLFTLAMIGVVGSRKGLHRAIEALGRLVQSDSRYRLKVFGKAASEYDWMKRMPEEMAYYDKISDEIKSRRLGTAVQFLGHADVQKALAAENVGFVLSVSDSGELPESFHLAVLDGFACGGVSLVLRWNGAEYIFPSEIILGSVEQLVERISMLSTPEAFQSAVDAGRTFVSSRYSIGAFVHTVKAMLQEVR